MPCSLLLQDVAGFLSGVFDFTFNAKSSKISLAELTTFKGDY